MQGLVGVAGIHLVGRLVALAEVRPGSHGIAERAVERRRVLRRIRQDAHVDMVAGVQRAPEGAHAPVHHVGRRDHIGAGLCVSKRLLLQDGNRFVVQHITRRVDEAVLPMAGVGVERDVGDDAHLRKAGLHFANASGHQAFRIECFLGTERLAGSLDDREKRDRGNPEGECLLYDREERVDRPAAHAGHGGHRLDGVPALEHEHGQDQVVGRQAALAREAAREIVAAHAAHAPLRKTSEWKGHCDRSGRGPGNFSMAARSYCVKGYSFPASPP